MRVLDLPDGRFEGWLKRDMASPEPLAVDVMIFRLYVRM